MNPHAYRILVEGAGLEVANGEYMHLQHPGAEEGSVEFVRQDEEGYVYNVMRGKGTWYINRCNRDGVIAVGTFVDSRIFLGGCRHEKR